MLRWNKALRLDVWSHVTILNEFKCFISVPIGSMYTTLPIDSSNDKFFTPHAP